MTRYKNNQIKNRSLRVTAAQTQRTLFALLIFFVCAMSLGAHATLANFQTYCSGCHGSLPNGPNYNTAGATTVFSWANGNGAGQGNMGASSAITPATIASIVAYIETVRPTISNLPVVFNTSLSVTFPDLYFNSALNVAGGINAISIGSGPMAGAAVTAFTKSVHAGSVTYTPKANYCGADTFGYTGTGVAGSTTTRVATVLVACPAAPTLTSAATATGTIGILSSTYQIVSSAGTFQYAASGLPPGLSVNATNGQITGTPTGSGSFSVTLTGFTALSVSTNQVVTFTILPASPVITSAGIASGTIGTPFGAGYTITATNLPISFSTTTLPPGLSVDAVTGVITGTPSAAGTFNATVSANNANPTPGTKAVTFTIFPAIPIITSGNTVSGTAGSAITVYQITATNSPITFAASVLPAGLSINAAGLISGTPTLAGTFNVAVSAANTNPTAGTQTVTFTIVPPSPVITSSAAANGQTGVVLSPSYTITAINSPASYAATGLPPGLMLNTTTGVISGTPTTLGSFNVSLSATNANPTPGSLALTFNITLGPPVITSTGIASGAVAAVFSGYQITASNGPLTAGGYAATALPAGLSLNASGFISGTPAVGGTFNVGVTATNASATSAVKTVVFSIAQFVPVITSATSANGQTGVPFSYQITANNGTSAGFSFTGTLPAGLALNSTTGLISGTPSAVGAFTPTLVASNGAGNGSQVTTFNITLGAPVITSGLSASGSLATPFTYQITATNSPTAFNASGLPSGLSASATGLISGSPSAQGTFTATISAQNGTGTASQTLTISIGLLSPVISSAASATATIGVPFSYQISATNFPTSFNATGLPAGVTVNTATGQIVGTPSVIGSFSIALSATNATGTGNQTLLITVALAAPIITSANAATGGLSQPFAYQITASNFPTSFSASGLPGGLSINAATGFISGSPGATGTFNVNASATNSIGTGSITLSLTIANAPPPISSGLTVNVVFNTALQINLTSAVSGLVTGFSLATLPAHGTAVLSGNIVTYTPALGYFGADSFTFTSAGPGGISARAGVSLVVGTPPAPTASASSAPATFNTPTVIDLSSAVMGVFTSINIVMLPANGTLIVNDRTITYTPRTGFFGTDSFTYTVTGPGGTSASAELTVTVGTLAPTASSLNFILPLNTPTTIDLAPFISGSAISGIVVMTVPAHGVANVNGTKVTYTPATDFFGVDSFTYAAFGNAGKSTPAAVKVTVTGRPDPTKQAAVTGLVAAQVETADRFAKAQISNFQSRMESMHRGGEANTPAKSSANNGATGMASSAGINPNPNASVGTAKRDQGSDAATTVSVQANSFLDRSYASSAVSAPAGTRDVDPANFKSGGRPVADAFPFSSELVSLLVSRSLNVASLAGSVAGNSGSANSGSDPAPRPNFWIAGTANFGLRQANSQRSALDFSTSGISLGVDQRFSDQLLLGLGAGFARDKTQIGNDGSESRASGYSGVAYASYQPGPQTFIDGLIGIGSLDFKSRRYVAVMDAMASGNRRGTQIFGSVAAGYEYRNNGVLLSPYGRLDYSSNKLKESGETGAGQYALTFFGQTTPSLQGVAGFRAETINNTSFGTAAPRLRLEYRHEFQGSSDASVGYADLAGGPRFGIYTGSVARNGLALGFGADFVRREGLKIALDYELLHSFNRDTNQSIRLNMTQDLDGRGGPFTWVPSKPNDIQVDAGYVFDGNVTRAKESTNKRSDRSTSLNAGRALVYTFDRFPNIRALVTYSAGGEKFQNYDGLSRASAGLQGELQYRPSSEFDAATFSVTAQSSGEYFQSVLRRGFRSSIAGSVRVPITDRVNISAALAHNERDARSDVFKSRDNVLRFGVDYAFSATEALYLNGEFRRGHFVSTGKASLENLSIADVFVVDDAFLGTGFLTYRTKGKTVLSTLGYNLGLGQVHSIDLSWRRVMSTPEFRPSFATSPRSYVVDQYSLVYLMRF